MKIKKNPTARPIYEHFKACLSAGFSSILRHFKANLSRLSKRCIYEHCSGMSYFLSCFFAPNSPKSPM